MTTLKKVIIDTDIGDDIDDAIAILLAIYSNKLDILGVTTVYRDTHKRAQIAKGLVQSVGINIPVYKGESISNNEKVTYALFEKFDTNGEVMMPYYLPSVISECYEQDMDAIQYMNQEILKYPNEVSILALGPLTNLAKFKELYPESFNLIKEIIFMGGQTRTTFKEWNIRCDIDAAVSVFGSTVPMRVVGLDITSTSKLTENQLEIMKRLKNSKQGSIFHQMLMAYLDYFDGTRMPTMHDPLTIGCFIDGFCTFEKKPVLVVSEGSDRGRTIIEEEKSINHIELAVDVDIDGFMNYLIETLEKNL